MNKEQMFRILNELVLRQRRHYRRSAIISYDEIRPKRDKLSPKKRMKAHKIEQGIRKETFVSPRLSYTIGKWRDRQ